VASRDAERAFWSRLIVTRRNFHVAADSHRDFPFRIAANEEEKRQASLLSSILGTRRGCRELSDRVSRQIPDQRLDSLDSRDENAA